MLGTKDSELDEAYIYEDQYDLSIEKLNLITYQAHAFAFDDRHE